MERLIRTAFSEMKRWYLSYYRFLDHRQKRLIDYQKKYGDVDGQTIFLNSREGQTSFADVEYARNMAMTNAMVVVASLMYEKSFIEEHQSD
jgi:hypothetical protein